MLPFNGPGYHHEKTRRFLAEVNREVGKSPDLSSKRHARTRLSHRFGEYLIDLGRALTRTAQADPS